MNINEKFIKQTALRKQFDWEKRTNPGKDSIEYFLNTDDLKHSFDTAYLEKDSTFRDVGISYRINPLTGEREMFIAGSGNIGDWIYNVTNTISYGLDKILEPSIDRIWKRYKIPFQKPKLKKLAIDRRIQQKGVARKARNYKADRIYGHSRAGAIVADTETKAEKIGVDSAMLLAENINMKNYHRDSLFDKALALSGKRNKKVKSGRSIHWAYGRA